MGGSNEPPDGPSGSDEQRPEWETTEFPSFPGYGYPGDDGSQDFGQPSYGYGTPPSTANPSSSGGGDGQQAYPAQQSYPNPQDYPGQQDYSGQQGYPGQGYPGQQPPPGQWPPQSPGWQGQPPPPDKGRPTALIAAAAVLVAAGAGVGIYFATSSSGDGKKQADPTDPISAPASPTDSAPTETTPTDTTPTDTTPTQTTPTETTPTSTPPVTGGKVVVPQTFDGYTRLNNAAAQATKKIITGDTGGAGATLLKSATVEVYGPSGSQLPSLITISLPTSAVPGAESSSIFVTSFLTGAGVQAKQAGTNTHGGSASCGVPAGAGSTPDESACAWSDSSTSGAILSTQPALSPGKLAAVQDAFRGKLR